MRIFITLLLLFTALSLPAQSAPYNIVIEGFDWGPAVTKVVVPFSGARAGAELWDVRAKREHTSGLNDEAERPVQLSYPSDDRGNRQAEGAAFTTLVLTVSPHESIDNPIQYINGGNVFIDYSLQVTHTPTGTTYTEEGERFFPTLAGIDLDQTFSHTEGTTLTYASYAPATEGKRPLIVWLHGGGEGGTDTRIVLLANRAVAYAEEPVQAIMGGAYVLYPQAPTFWMQSLGGEMTWGDQPSRFTPALQSLIEAHVAANPGIDPDRIYVGGCSNGGFMTLELLLNKPGYYAAAFPSAVAYRSQNLSADEITELAKVPLWFVHAADDPVTRPLETAVPVVKRLKDAGAANLHFSYFDHITDATGLFGGDDYWYNGHFSWIPCHNNACWSTINGQPTTIMTWLSHQ